MERLRILPVFPEFPKSFWGYNYAVELLGKKATMAPTPILTVAAMVPEDTFDMQRVIDLNVEPLKDEEIERADLIFTSSMIVQRDSLEDIIKRAHHFGKPVVAGGPYPTSYKDEVPADHLVLGEAEITLQPFLRDLLKGTPKKMYEEHSIDPSEITIELTRNRKPIITNTPVPRWDLINLKKYVVMPIQYSRGCPFDCDFCDITKLFGKESRTKTPAQMINEFNALYERKWRGPVFIVDDNFIGNAHNVRELLPHITKWQKEHKYPFSLFTEASMNLGILSYRDILEGMVKAGFDQVFLGIESIDPDVIRKMQKGQNLGDPYEKVRNIQRAGLEVTGGFIIGGDNEKPTVFENLFNFIQKAGIVIPMPGLLTALRGTDLYKRLEREGRLIEESTGNNTHHFGFNFKTELDEKFLVEGYTVLLEKLFDSKNYFNRCRTLDANRGEYHNSDGIGLPEIRAFTGIACEKLIRHPDKEAASYLRETLRKAPKKFPLAVAQTVKLHHFQTMTKANLDVYRYKQHTETLYERFERAAEQIKQGAGDFVISLRKLEKGILKEAAQKCRRIHKDFRENAQEAYNQLSERVNEYKNRYYTNALTQ
ncbi:MAG: B12-binding domain-containing radical SAM protein [Nanoarchaeota archaeon]|nr:B12-binding domain-containing radical SAM protein [Nanoarchaeota archaeon]